MALEVRAHIKAMKTVTILAVVLLLLGVQAADAPGDSPANQCFELRIDHARPGSFGALQARFRDHGMALMAKHGIIVVGFWVPLARKDGAGETLIYLLAHPSRQAADENWLKLRMDPEWEAVVKASETGGPLVSYYDTKFLAPTDYSPTLKVAATDPPRTFELRTYRASPGKLDALNARFRDHTVAIFAKHGMSALGYWTPLRNEPGAGQTLIYILCHKGRNEASAAWRAPPRPPAALSSWWSSPCPTAAA